MKGNKSRQAKDYEIEPPGATLATIISQPPDKSYLRPSLPNLQQIFEFFFSLHDLVTIGEDIKIWMKGWE